MGALLLPLMHEDALHEVILETLFTGSRFTAQKLEDEDLLPTFFFSSWSASFCTFAPPGPLGIYPHTTEFATFGTGRKINVWHHLSVTALKILLGRVGMVLWCF